MAVKNTLDPKIDAMLQDAVHSELWASHLYKHVSNQMQRLGYFGAAKYFAAEAASELEHYQRHADYLNKRGSVAQIPQLMAVTDAVPDLRAALQLAYDTELQLMQDYAKWDELCDEAMDAATDEHLHFYHRTQADSVGEYGDLLARMDLAGSDRSAILMIDREMGEG